MLVYSLQVLLQYPASQVTSAFCLFMFLHIALVSH